MATIIGYVQKINGEFKAISPDGGERILSIGDPVYEGETLQGDGSNDSTIVVALENTQTEITLAGNEPLLFDASLFEKGFTNEEVAFEDDDYFNSMVSNIDTLEDVETEAGEEKTSDTATDLNLEFKARDGQEADVNSKLSSTKFLKAQTKDLEEKEPDAKDTPARTQSYSDTTDYSQKTPEENERETAGNIPVDIISVIPPTIVPPADVLPIPTPVAPIVNSHLTLNGANSVNEGGSVVYTITSTEAPLSNLNIKVEISHIDTDSGDLVAKIVDVVIPTGAKSTTFSVDNIQNIYAEPNENYQVKIIQTTGGGFDQLTGTTATLTTTIVDDNLDENGVVFTPTITLNGTQTIEEGSSGNYTLYRRSSC